MAAETSAGQAEPILVGHDIFDLTTSTWRGSLKVYRPIWVHAEGPLAWVASEDGDLRALSLQDGAERWRRDLPAEPTLLALGHDEIAVATRDEVWAFDRYTGAARELLWLEDAEVEHLAAVGQHLAVALTDNRVLILNVTTGETVTTLFPQPTDRSDLPPNQRPIGTGAVHPHTTTLLPTRRMTFCVVTELERHYDLRCIDPWGGLVWRERIEHTAESWVDGVARVLDKRLALRGMGQRWLLFAPCGPGEESVLVRLATGGRTVLPFEVTAVVEDDDGQVCGLLAVDAEEPEQLAWCDPDTGAARWTLQFDFAPCDQAAAARGPHGLIIALYHAFQREVVVFAVDEATGQTRWRERLEIPAASYRLRHEFNRVTLVQHRDAVVVRMLQEPRAFLRVLDPETGRCSFPASETPSAP